MSFQRTCLSLGICDDLTGDASHVGHCTSDDGSGGEGTEKLGLSSQRSSIELSNKQQRVLREKKNHIKRPAEQTDSILQWQDWWRVPPSGGPPQKCWTEKRKWRRWWAGLQPSARRWPEKWSPVMAERSPVAWLPAVAVWKLLVAGALSALLQLS